MIDKLLNKLEEHDSELALSSDEECVICISAKATVQTFPCGHNVVCRKCFVKTIQVAVSQRLLPLKCVICRTKILRLKQTSHINIENRFLNQNKSKLTSRPLISKLIKTSPSLINNQLSFATFVNPVLSENKVLKKRNLAWNKNLNQFGTNVSNSTNPSSFENLNHPVYKFKLSKPSSDALYFFYITLL